MATVVVGVCEVVWCFLLFVKFPLSIWEASSVFCKKKKKRKVKKSIAY